jgi:arginine/lysine/ornithine decarboxylase
MQNLFFSQAYIDAHIEQLQSFFPYALITDSTYHNDQCASIQIKDMSSETTYLLFLPNSLVNEEWNEKYSHYALILDEEYAEAEKTIFETFSNLVEITTLELI